MPRAKSRLHQERRDLLRFFGDRIGSPLMTGLLLANSHHVVSECTQAKALTNSENTSPINNSQNLQCWSVRFPNIPCQLKGSIIPYHQLPPCPNHPKLPWKSSPQRALRLLGRPKPRPDFADPGPQPFPSRMISTPKIPHGPVPDNCT